MSMSEIVFKLSCSHLFSAAADADADAAAAAAAPAAFSQKHSIPDTTYGGYNNVVHSDPKQMAAYMPNVDNLNKKLYSNV